MWEVFALTSLIFTALGIVEYKKGKGNITFPKEKEKEVRLVHSTSSLEENEEPKQFIKLRLGEEKKEEVKPSLLNINSFENNNSKNKEDAKRMWENHYIVKSVKERFAKGEERNYGVFTEEEQHPPSNYFKKDDTVDQSPSPSDIISSLPIVPTTETSSITENKENSGNNLPSGVFGSLLKEREQSSELNLVGNDQEEIKKEQKKGEEFNPFDVLGGF